MAHWSRRARWIVAAAGLVFAVVVYVGIRQRDKPGAAEPIAPADPRADVEITGATSRRWSGASENFTVRAERQFLYRDGGVKLQGVTVYVDDTEGNRKFVATGQEGEAGPKQDYVHLKGNVELVSSDGLKVQTAEASYSTGEGIVRAPGEVKFSRGRLTGHGMGMTYDRSKNVLTLLDQATMSLAPDEQNSGALEVSAASIALARKDKYVNLDRQVRIIRQGREITSDSAVGYLNADESHLTSLDLRGNSHIVSRPPESSSSAAPSSLMPGAVEDMSARDISLTFGPDGERIERAVLTGAASIRLAAEEGKSGRRISGQSVTLGLDADGNTVTALSARDHVELDFPADEQNPPRHISAASLEGTSEGKGALTAARLRDDVEYREVVEDSSDRSTTARRSSAPAVRVVHARVLDLMLTPGLSGITDARFSGAVRFDQGDLHATASAAQYHVAEGAIDLLGEELATPTVTDSRMTVDARQILLKVDGPKIVANDTVRSVLRPDQKRATDEGASDPVKVPGFLTENRPVNITANALDYDGSASRATYSGNARLWQGDAAVQAETLIIETSLGNLRANGSVRSSWMVEQADEKTKQKNRVPNIATAGELEYDDQARRATYRTDAHLNGPPGDLAARIIELYLDQQTNEITRLEGYEAVTFRQGARSATGDRLSYVAAEQRYLMNGTPVHIVEECRDSIGRSLTFYKSTDRVVVDGQQLSRTRTKGGTGCAESRR